MFRLLELTILAMSLFGVVQCAELPPIAIKPHYKVASVIYDGFVLTDLIGPTDVTGFNVTNFSQTVIGKEGNSFVQSSVNGFYLKTAMSLEQAANLSDSEKFDMVVIGGGDDKIFETRKDKEFISNLGKLLKRADIVLTVCTGASIVAETGELDNKQATTNKILFYDYIKPFTKVDWVYKARWIHDKGGKYITSSGVSAGYDAALYIVSRIYGKPTAQTVANMLEFNVTWDSTNDPFAV